MLAREAERTDAPIASKVLVESEFFTAMESPGVFLDLLSPMLEERQRADYRFRQLRSFSDIVGGRLADERGSGGNGIIRAKREGGPPTRVVRRDKSEYLDRFAKSYSIPKSAVQGAAEPRERRTHLVREYTAATEGWGVVKSSARPARQIMIDGVAVCVVLLDPTLSWWRSHLLRELRILHLEHP